MPEYFPPPLDYNTTHDDVLVLGCLAFCTALLTLTMFSSSRSAPAPP